MEPNNVTAKLIEHSESLSAQSADIAALKNGVQELRQRSAEHGAIVESIHELALSVRELTGKVADVDGRLAAVESDRRLRSLSLWQAVCSAIAGGVITYIFSALLNA